VFATQSLADVERSTIAPALIESCPTRIFLPNDRAREPQARAVYERFGLNDRQIEILSVAAPKRDYYAQTARGNRLFELGLGPVALTLCGASSPDDQKLVDHCVQEDPASGFTTRFLTAKGLTWAADLIQQWQPPATPPPLQASVAARNTTQSVRSLAEAANADDHELPPLAIDKTPLPGLPGGPPIAERLSPFRAVPSKSRRNNR
jgi:type IV secretion system protein VirB4